MTEETETYAIVLHDRLPYGLFEDMETATEYVEEHDRMKLEDGTTQVMWPIRVIHSD